MSTQNLIKDEVKLLEIWQSCPQDWLCLNVTDGLAIQPGYTVYALRGICTIYHNTSFVK